jgi:hypothetical protein
LEKATGKYFDTGIEKMRSSTLFYDMENALGLWNTSAAYTKLTQSETLQGLIKDTYLNIIKMKTLPDKCCLLWK